MQIDPEAAIKAVEKYIERVDHLSKKPFSNGLLESLELDTSIQNFVRTTFPDGEVKLEGYPKLKNQLAKAGTKEARQQIFIFYLIIVRHHLNAFKDELELKAATLETSKNLGKLEKEIEERAAEAKRREKVAEGKAYGALIEIIDSLRQELKRKSERDHDIIEIKKDIKDLKVLIQRLTETLSKKEGG